MKSNLYIQFSGKEIKEEDIVAAAKEAWKEAGNKAKDLKTFDIYVKPEESAAYYVINEDFSGKYTF